MAINLLCMFIRLKRHLIGWGTLQDESDELLISRYKQTGDPEIIAELFDRYTHLVYGVCFKYFKNAESSKDAVMEIFESLFDKLTVHSVDRFRNWIYTVAKNYCLMQIRKNEAGSRYSSAFYNEEAKTTLNCAEHEEEMQEWQQMLQNSMGLQNGPQLSCIRMLYFEDKSYREIADLTGFSLKEVKSHIQNGKRNLKNHLLSQHGPRYI